MNTIECDKCGKKIDGDHREYLESDIMLRTRAKPVPKRTLHLCLVCVHPFNQWLKSGNPND